MPVLAADQVTLGEVLEVKGGPLTEQQLWSLLCLSSEALQDVFLNGKVWEKGRGLFTITPESLLLCFSGRVKFSLSSAYHDRSFIAPETYARKTPPSGSALEKICVYSLGMTLYHAAEYEVPVGKKEFVSFNNRHVFLPRVPPGLSFLCRSKVHRPASNITSYEFLQPISVSDSLENVLLSMCEEAAQARFPLVQVIKECHKRHGRRRYKDIIISLVKSVLGNEVPVVESDVVSGASPTNNHFINGDSHSSFDVSLDLASPRNLPSPPLLQTSTRGLSTAAELVGPNHRQVQTPLDLERSLQSANHVPHVLDKYKKHIEKSRSERSLRSPENMGTTLGKSNTGNHDLRSPSRPSWYQPDSVSGSYGSYHTGKEPIYYDIEDKGYSEGPAQGLQQNGRHKPDLISSTGFHGLRRYGSEGSFTDTSSYMSGPRSLFSDGRSSSAVSLTQGSYAPECYVNDGYESDQYMRSIGSSVSRTGFREGRESQLSRPFSSTSDLSPRSVHKQISVNSVPYSDEVDLDYKSPTQYSSVPNFQEEHEPITKNSKGTGSKTKLKTFFGPEFVQISEDPNKSIVNITSRKGGQLPQGRKMVTVVMLNGQRLQIMVEVSSKTQALFDQVIKYLGITEKIFFGITQLQEEEHIFLDLEVKLSKYAPAKWKEEKKGKNVNFTLFFRVKFYVEHMSLITHSKTRHQYYLQLRKDILEARLHCHEEAAFILAGLALQAEISDYDENLGQNYFMAEHYLPHRILAKLPENQAYEHLPEIHENFAGLSDDQAELEFLKEAQKLPEYGIHFYKVSTSKKSNGEEKYLGVCVRGVTVYEACGHIKTPVHRNSWQMTKKLSFQKKKFFIEPRDSESRSGNAPKLTFYTKHYKKAKYLLQMCTAFHRFQVKMKSRLAAVEQEVTHEASRKKLQNGVHQSPYQRRSYERSESLPEKSSVYRTKPAVNVEQFPGEKDDNRRLQSNDRLSVDRPVNGQFTLRRMSKVSSEEEFDVQRHSLSDESDTLSDRQRHVEPSLHQTLVDQTVKRSVDAPYVIDASVSSQALAASEQHLQMTRQEVFAGNIRQEVAPSPDRQIKVIKLERERGKEIGITVVGGENSKRLDLGIYVKSITEGGPAWKDGRLKAGDRILAVNGQSLEQVTHEFAVGVLKNAPPRMELVVSQSPHNVSSFDISSVPSPKYYGEEPETLEVKPLLNPRRGQWEDTVDAPQTQHQLERLPSRQGNHEQQLGLATRPQTDQDVDEEDGEDGHPEQHPSSLSFPSEDEPVTMVSKSISSLAAQYERLPSPPKSEMSLDKEIQPVRQEQTFADPSFSFEREDDYSVRDDLVTTEQKFKRRQPESITSFLSTNELSSLDSASTSAVAEYPPMEDREKVTVSVKPSDEAIPGLPSGIPYNIGLSESNDMEYRDDQANEGSSNNPSEGVDDKSFVVDLDKKDGSLGLSVTGGINTSVKLGGIYVKSLYPNGPADLDGRIRVGDRILDVNGISLVGVTHKQAVETIKRAPPITRLVVDRSVPVNISSRSTKRARPQVTDKPFTVELAKGVGGLGLSLIGGTDAGPEHAGLLRIKKMFPGQPAALCGKLQVGDIVEEVNGNSLEGVTHQEAINHIRVAGPVVQLLVKRDPSSIPSSLLSRSSSNVSDIDPAQILAEIQSKLRQNGEGTGIESNGRPFGLTPKSSIDSHSSVASVKSSNQIAKEEEIQLLESPLLANSGQEQVDIKQSKRSNESCGKVFVHQSSEPSLPTQDMEHGSLATSHSFPHNLLPRPVVQVRSLESSPANPVPSVVETGLSAEEKEDEEVSSKATSKSASDVEEISVDEPRPFDSRFDNQHKDEPSPESSLDEDELPTAEPANGQLLTATEPANGQLSSVAETETNTSLTAAEEIMEIELVKGSGGLGFTLAGGADTTGGCFVRDVIGDPAKADGRLQKGDQIIKVDNIDITGLKHMAAVNILRSTDKRVKLVVLRRPETVVSYGQSGVMETVNLTRTSRGRIGLIIKESEEDGGIYVDDVVPGEPAAVEGNLKNGDLILEINGQKVHGTGFLAARQCLDAARPVVRLLVERKTRMVESKYTMGGPQVSNPVHPDEGVENRGFSGDSDSEDEQQGLEDAKNDVFSVELKKGDRGFGFSLVAAPTSIPDIQGIFIKTVSPGSVAEKDGRMKVGDQLLKVNGEDVRGMSHARVISMLRKITGTVRLDLARSIESLRDLHVSSPPPHSGTDTNSKPNTNTHTSGNQRTDIDSRREQLARGNSGSLDLDITLEDKSNSLTGSEIAKDEDDVSELLNAIAEENRRLQNKPPQVHRRDTDSVLTSLLTSIHSPQSPPDSVPPLDVSETDSEPEEPPDSPWENSRGRRGTDPSDWASAEDSLPEDSVKRRERSSEESGNPKLNRFSASSSTDSIDIADDSDLDVFDMLRDNSQIVIDAINESNQPVNAKSVMDSSRNNKPSMHLVRDENTDGPPPIPTTPIPSDDELIAPERKPLRDFIAKSRMENGGVVQDVPDLPPKRGSYRQNNSDGVIDSQPRRPLIHVASGGRYSGNQLKALINSLQGKLESNLPADEFKALREVKLVDGCDTAKKTYNKDKNRYRNVLPFDKTRVKLSSEGDADYINANHVKVKVGEDTYNYIASQGPLPSTTADFWQMVWEQQVQVIGMLTLEVESGKVKCHKYWPEAREEPLVVGDSFEVSLLSKKLTDTHIERMFTLRNLLEGTSMNVVHLNFTRWPDHGVPKCSAELVQYIQHMRSLPSRGPIVVHCSAGIGRTGALIAVDVALGLMERDLPFDIDKTIRRLREQRPGMIQTKEQYTFCYKACLDVLRSLDS